MSTYITCIVAGEYHVVTGTYTGDHGDVPLGLFCRQSLAVDELVFEPLQVGVDALGCLAFAQVDKRFHRWAPEGGGSK